MCLGDMMETGEAAAADAEPRATERARFSLKPLRVVDVSVGSLLRMQVFCGEVPIGIVWESRRSYAWPLAPSFSAASGMLRDSQRGFATEQLALEWLVTKLRTYLEQFLA